MQPPPSPNSVSIVALKVGAIYALFSGLWILLSDTALHLLVPDPDLLSGFQTFKGAIFVLITTALLVALVNRYAGELRRRDEALTHAGTRLTPAIGAPFFTELLSHLSRSLQVDYAFVGELLEGPSPRVRTVALFARGEQQPAMEYSLENTPCANVLAGEACSYPQNVRQLFPKDRLLSEMDVESYVGIPLLGASQQPLGLLVVMHGSPLNDEPFARKTMQLFAVRAAAELDRQRAERELHEQFEQLTAIFDSLSAAVYVADLETYELLYLNRFGENLFGVDWPGKRCFEALHGRTEGPCDFCTNRQLVRDGEPQPPLLWEFQNPANLRWYQCIDKAIRWTDGRLVHLEIAIDITDRKEMDRMKDQILSAVSHEMHTPLTAILGYTEYMLENELPAGERQSYLNILYREGERLSSLINNFLNLQRMRARRQKYAVQAIAVEKLLQQVARQLEHLAGQHRLRVRCPEAPLTVRGNQEGLFQVMENLVANAVKYSPPGSEVVLGARRQGGNVIVSVQDQGIGIPESDQEHVFEQFHRLDNSDTRKTGGAGLGLALVQEIIREHGGEVWVESREGAGSTFSFSLPAIPADQVS